MEFSRQEYSGGLPFPTPEDLPYPGIELMTPMPPVLAGGFFAAEPPRKPHFEWKTFLMTSSFFFFLILPGENHNSKRYMHPSVHCSAIYNSSDMETT